MTFKGEYEDRGLDNAYEVEGSSNEKRFYINAGKIIPVCPHCGHENKVSDDRYLSYPSFGGYVEAIHLECQECEAEIVQPISPRLFIEVGKTMTLENYEETYG